MKKIVMTAIAGLSLQCALAGGYLTNTNLSAAFLRNPAREGALAIDGLYSNPAGVTFLTPGLHIQATMQSAFQHRYIDTEYAPFALNINHYGKTRREIKGVANAPFIPSVHASYNLDRWFVGFTAGVVGGGGKCTFDKGLSSFEQISSTICAGLAPQLAALGTTLDGYTVDSRMRGKQFYLGYQLGAGLKLNDQWAGYVGGRVTQAISNYYGSIENVQLRINGTLVPAQATLQQYASLTGNEASATYANMVGDIKLNCDQQGWGIAPVIGVDYRMNDALNIGLKYEFRTKMTLRNHSVNVGGESISALQQFADGTKVREDIPALLAAGAQYSILPQWHISASYHQYFDKDAKKYGDKQKLLSGNAWEVLAGTEYDLNERLTISCGMQSTNYANTDEYMNDMSFVTDSYSLGCGLSYSFNENWTLDLGYFQTFYSDYNKTSSTGGVEKKDKFTRDNKVIGVSLTANF